MLKEVFTMPFDYGKVLSIVIGMIIVLTPLVTGLIIGIYRAVESIADRVGGAHG